MNNQIKEYEKLMDWCVPMIIQILWGGVTKVVTLRPIPLDNGDFVERSLMGEFNGIRLWCTGRRIDDNISWDAALLLSVASDELHIRTPSYATAQEAVDSLRQQLETLKTQLNDLL